LLTSGGAATLIARQKQSRRLRYVISELVRRLPKKERQREDVKKPSGCGCLTRMQVVRLLAPPARAGAVAARIRSDRRLHPATRPARAPTPRGKGVGGLHPEY
jgi:hypothetical protein